MECHDVLERSVDWLAGELSKAESGDVQRHLDACASCRSAVEETERAWTRLAADPDPSVTPEFREETLALLEAETLRRKVSAFPGRRFVPALAIAASLATGVTGFFLARATMPKSGEPRTASASSSTTRAGLVAAASLPDLSRQPKLANVSFQPADPEGRIGISFDVTKRYTVTGKPGDQGVSDLLAYLVAGQGLTEGARGKAIDLVSQHYTAQFPASPQIVATLIQTLKKDTNPGVRKKAAEALAQMPATPEIRDAFLAALKSDDCPAVRIVAVENLATAAMTLRDPAAIETLREKASDSQESGYVRVKAASALKKINL
jgi:hypothetical protein